MSALDQERTSDDAYECPLYRSKRTSLERIETSAWAASRGQWLGVQARSPNDRTECPEAMRTSLADSRPLMTKRRRLNAAFRG